MEGRRLMTLQTQAAPLITGEIILKRDISIFWGAHSFISVLTPWKWSEGKTVTYICLFCSRQCCLSALFSSTARFSSSHRCITFSTLGFPFIFKIWLPCVLDVLPFGEGSLCNLLYIYFFVSLKFIYLFNIYFTYVHFKKKANLLKHIIQKLHMRHLWFMLFPQITIFSIIKDNKEQHYPPRRKTRPILSDRYILDTFGLVPK